MSGALQALSAQVSLAIDGAVMAENLHRRRSEARFRVAGRALQRPDHRRRRAAASSPTRARRSRSARLAARRRPAHPLRPARAAQRPPARDAGDRAGRGRHRRHRHGRVHAAQPLRRVAPVRDPPHQPARGSRRPGHRPQLPRRQRAQGVRGPARPPGLPRPVTGLANRALFADRVQHALARAGPRAGHDRRRLHRPRRLQDDQRQPRPRGRRRRAAGGLAAAAAPPCARPTPPPASAATSSPC